MRYSDHALALAPELGEVHIARAAALETHDNLSAAEQEYRRGIELAPGNASGYQLYGELLVYQFGRFDEALPLLEKAVALDPLSPSIRDMHVLALGLSGRTDEALALSNQLIAEQPDIAIHYDTRAGLHGQQGDLVAVLRDLRTEGTLDPEAVSSRPARCYVLITVGALVEAKSCLATLTQHAPASYGTLYAQSALAMIAGDAAGAQARIAQMQPPDELDRAGILLATGQAAEALAIYRRLKPDLFAQPTPKLYPAQAADAIQVGIAMVKTGAQAQGRPLLTAAIAAIAHRPYTAVIVKRGWLEVYAYTYLGQTDHAFAAMQAAVSGGLFFGLAELDSDPLLADLRADPRYAKILAPARTRAAAQIEAARKEGLL